MSYLNTSHRDNPASGCAVAALAEDAARADGRTRAAYARQVKEYHDVLDTLLSSADAPKRDSAVLTLSLSALVGALLIARAVDDEDLSRRVLKETAESLKLLLGP